MIQPPLHDFSCGVIQHGNLLIARVKITSYNQHCSAPFLRALVSSALPSLLGRKEPTPLSNQQLQRQSCRVEKLSDPSPQLQRGSADAPAGGGGGLGYVEERSFDCVFRRFAQKKRPGHSAQDDGEAAASTMVNAQDGVFNVVLAGFIALLFAAPFR